MLFLRQLLSMGITRDREHNLQQETFMIDSKQAARRRRSKKAGEEGETCPAGSQHQMKKVGTPIRRPPHTNTPLLLVLLLLLSLLPLGQLLPKDLLIGPQTADRERALSGALVHGDANSEESSRESGDLDLVNEKAQLVLPEVRHLRCFVRKLSA